MAGKRRKAPQQRAPQTIEEATDRLAEYADLILGIEELRQDADGEIAKMEAARDALVAPMEEKAKALFLELRAFWSVAGDGLTEGKRKSIELAGCQIGVRTTTPSLNTGKMKVEDAVAMIDGLIVKADEADNVALLARLFELIRVKRELDKPAILRALAADEIGPLLAEAGFSRKQKDEFFIDRAGPKPAAVEKVAVS